LKKVAPFDKKGVVNMGIHRTLAEEGKANIENHQVLNKRDQNPGKAANGATQRKKGKR